ncbi:uncharacterized protein LOC132282058 [Cornus florida]|uniref:uncharacterized protein LOC132282058 n=1 Tax=Cornus florida TaxID=4283 RepID=UPI0028966F67|nr:uncharacterized protein LOC132282058 [Cornus florida]
MNTSAKEGTETENAQGQMERSVDTVDYRSSPGQCQELRPVQVVHQSHSPPAVDSNSSGAILADAAASVASALQSAREVLSRNNSTNSKHQIDS